MIDFDKGDRVARAADVTVIGGGLIGMLSARELALAGMKVHLLERHEIGRESSWAGGGILSPLFPWRYPDAVTALAAWSQQRYQGLAEALAEETGIDPEWTQNGLLMLGAEERAEAEGWASRQGYALELLRDAEVTECEPRLGLSAQQALWMPAVAQIRNPRLLRAMRASLLGLGVGLSEGIEVTGFGTQAGRVTGIDTPDGPIASERVVLAGGAWTGRILRSTGIELPIRPVRGQMLLFKGAAGLVSRIVLSGDRYVIPRRDGRVLVGSTVEEAGFEKVTTEQAREELYRSALSLVPALADFPVERHWAGLRPGSPQGIPYIGEHPDIAGLFVNAGHFRNGVVLGPASARLLVDQALGHPPILDPSPYALPLKG